MSDIPRIGFYWCAACGGCEETVVDLAEHLLEVAAAVDIVFWPCAMDFKRSDVEDLADGAMTACFVNGAIRTDEQREMAELLRRKSRLIVALGSCATHGGVPALANLTSRREVLRTSYLESPTVDNPKGVLPQTATDAAGCRLELPAFHTTVRKLSDVVDVDYYLPGCAPMPDNLAAAVEALLQDELPETGSVLTPNLALCRDCPRNETKPDDVILHQLRRPHEIELDDEQCFLAQGVICLGPATRTGCGAACIDGNMPCTGCYGPTDNVRDQGAKMIATLGGILPGDTPAAVDAQLDHLPDPAGTLYRYSLSASLLGAARQQDLEDAENHHD